jgi:hypothetical protein
MMYLTKFTDKLDQQKVDLYNEVQLDMLWYIMDLTGIERFVTEESFREFLIRFFIIRNKHIDEYAMDVINDELIVDGFIGESYFELKINDLVNLVGFAKSSAKYNIRSSLTEFETKYKFKTPNVKFSKSKQKENTYEISQQALAYSLAGLHNLLQLENCSLQFKDDLVKLSDTEREGSIKLANFIVQRLPKNLFNSYNEAYPEVAQVNKERYQASDEVRFNIYKDMDQENLAKIYELLVDKETADAFREKGEDEDLKDELQWFNEQINFAYGVKHGYIKLSDEYNSLITEVDINFHYDYDMLLGDDAELYSTQYIYDHLRMVEWQYLLP